jgi:hypothetical protein
VISGRAIGSGMGGFCELRILRAVLGEMRRLGGALGKWLDVDLKFVCWPRVPD